MKGTVITVITLYIFFPIMLLHRSVIFFIFCNLLYLFLIKNLPFWGHLQNELGPVIMAVIEAVSFPDF